ncbi:MAG TPA: hypothetical protein VFE15_00420 [Marmoricola sp.]|nr:hypothetical protein [Marmoricola sp.]
MTGSDKGELHFEKALAISPSRGLLGIAHIPAVLNGEYKKYGRWTAVAPSSSTDYLSRIAVDTVAHNRPVIQNVQTKYLPYFNGVSLTHYDIAYGFNTQARTVAIGEEWDPHWTFGVLAAKYGPTKFGPDGPYRRWTKIPASSAFSAVHASPNHKILQ